MTKFFTLSWGGGGVSNIPIFHSFVFHSLSRGEGGKVNDTNFTLYTIFFWMSSLSFIFVSFALSKCNKKSRHLSHEIASFSKFIWVQIFIDTLIDFFMPTLPLERAFKWHQNEACWIRISMFKLSLNKTKNPEFIA